MTIIFEQNLNKRLPNATSEEIELKISTDSKSNDPTEFSNNFLSSYSVNVGCLTYLIFNNSLEKFDKFSLGKYSRQSPAKEAVDVEYSIVMRLFPAF